MTTNQLREYRKKLDYTQAELEQELGFSPGYISKLERGEKPITRVTELALKAVFWSHGIYNIE